MVSLPLAPAFIRSAPPMVPGMPNEEFHAADIGGCRRLRHALVERGRACADDIALGSGVSPNARGDRRITTPAMPPSRTIRLEPTPTT